MAHQFIVRRRQGQFVRTVLGTIDEGLGMLDANAHRKRLGLHGNAAFQQHFKGIPGGMADGKDGPIAVHRARGSLQTCQNAVFAAQARNLCIETDFTAQFNDATAKVLYHRQQYIGAHMGLGIEKDVLPCAKFHKSLQNPANPGIIDTGIQLSVGKGARAALAELDIAAGVQLTGGEKPLHFGVAAGRILAPLQNDGALTGHSKDQRRKHTRRTKAHHHRALFKRLYVFRKAVADRGGHRRPLAAALLQDLIFAAFHRNIHGINDLHIGFLAGIHRSADNAKFAHFRGR